MIKSARKYKDSNVTVKIEKIEFNSVKMSNKITWSISNPSNEKIKRIDFLIYSNNTSVENGKIESTKTLSPYKRNFIHNIDIVDGEYLKIYSYQVIVMTDLTSKSSNIERFSTLDIYECEPPKQITFKVKDNKIYFNIQCSNSKFNTNIFVFRKDFDDDTFERIAVLRHENQMFVDSANLILGHFYEYRFISYDIFGNFSQKIVKIKVRIWDNDMGFSKNKVILDPVPIGECSFDSTNNKRIIKLKISNIDPSCTNYFIKRRDNLEKGNKFYDIEQWYGKNVIKNNDSSDLYFEDLIVGQNSFYEYCVYGVDKFGNKTDIRYSKPIYTGIESNPALPINVSASIISEYPTGVKIEWIDNNLNQTVEQIISGSSELFPKTNLYYFKVFRRRYNELNYQSYPEQSSSFFTDYCDDDGVWKIKETVYYKPSPPIRDNQYYYFIKTYDGDGKESNHSSEIYADLTVYPLPVKNLKILFNDIISPLKCVLIWESQENDKTLDSFIIERLDQRKGLWEKIGRSYFSTKYIDRDIVANSKYIYRIRAEDFNGNQSQYSYAIFET